MNFVKKYFKFFIGVCVLILALVVFFFAQRSGTLETGVLKDWRSAAMDRRIAAAQILVGSDKNVTTLVACVDKMSTLPDSGEMAVRDAMSLCHTGMQLQESL